MFFIVLAVFIFVVMTEVDSLLWQAILIGIGGLSWFLLGILSYVIVAGIVIGIKIKSR